MIELRQRSSRNSGYQRLSLDEEELDVDDEEDIPLLTRPTPITQSVESSSCTYSTFHLLSILDIDLFGIGNINLLTI